MYLTEKELCKKLNCSRITARKIGEKAGARFKLTEKAGVRYEWEKIAEYLEANKTGTK